jgi:phosphocarrier protein HPr
MRKKKFIVGNKHGIHARVAMRIADAGKDSASAVSVTRGNRTADGSSVLQLLMLAADKGAEIEVSVNVGDEEKSIRMLTELFAEGSGI